MLKEGGVKMINVAMLLQQLPSTVDKKGSMPLTVKEQQTEHAFHELLASKQELGKMMDQICEKLPDDKTNWLSEEMSPFMQQWVSKWFETQGNERVQPEESLNKEIAIQIEKQLPSEQLLLGNESISITDEQSANLLIQKELTAIFSKVSTLLSQLNNQQNNQPNIQQAASKLVHLLQQWSELSKQVSTAGNTEKAIIRLNEGGNTKEATIWKQLVATFEKRSAFVQKQHYNNEAKISSGDVAKWLTKVMEEMSKTKQTTTYAKEPITTMNNINPTSVPMAKLEQHVIYLQPEQQTQRNTGQELVQQLQRIMQSSKFMKMPNGVNQLHLTLRPEHLGDMTVRFTQTDGVMAVRILVQSQAAKEMLESNIHKLRNMFSPQQVTIEKQEGILQQSQQMQKGTGSESQQYSDSQEQKQQEFHDDSAADNNEEFMTTFHELLMNEQV